MAITATCGMLLCMYEKRYFTIGQQNEDFLEIRKGLEVGEVVSLIQPESVH